MPELGPYGSVRGARGNSRPYRESSRQTTKMTRLMSGPLATFRPLQWASAARVYNGYLRKSAPESYGLGRWSVVTSLSQNGRAAEVGGKHIVGDPVSAHEVSQVGRLFAIAATVGGALCALALSCACEARP